MSSTFKRSRKMTSGVTTGDTATTKDSSSAAPTDRGHTASGSDPITTGTTTTTSPHDHVVTANHHHLPMSGTKFWTRGIVLTSTGLRELDNILLSSTGNSTTSSSSSSSSSARTSCIGGQPIGTCICLETDDKFLSWASPLSNCIVRYWCAEGISQDQALVIPIFNDNGANSDRDILEEASSWSSFDHKESQLNERSMNSMIVTNVDAVQELLDSLPRNNNMDVQQRTELLSKAAAASHNVETWNTPLETLTEEAPYEREGDDSDDEYYHENDEDATNHRKPPDADEGLVVAWQYRKDVQDERLGFAQAPTSNNNVPDKKRIQQQHAASVYCHTYNLQGRLKDQINIESHVTRVPMNTTIESTAGFTSNNSRIRHGVQLYQKLITLISATVSKSSSSRNTVVRLLLYHPDLSVTSFILPLLLHHVRKYKLPVIVLVNPRASSSSTKSDLHHIRRCSDVVLSTESFDLRDPYNYPPPSEFRNLHGLLHISRLSTMTQMCTVGHFAERTIQRTPISIRYGLYRDRRKLHISLLHIPPEEYSTDGGSVSNGAVRSGAGRRSDTATAKIGCSSSGGDGSTRPLDF